MAITINGKTFRNLPEQVEENAKNIETLLAREDKGGLVVYEVVNEEFGFTQEQAEYIFNNKPDVIKLTIGEEAIATYYRMGVGIEEEATVVLYSAVYDDSITNWAFQKANDEITYDQQEIDLSQALDDISELQTEVASKQDTLVSGTNIKTINNESVLGSGNISLPAPPSVSLTTTTGSEAITVDGTSLNVMTRDTFQTVSALKSFTQNIRTSVIYHPTYTSRVIVDGSQVGNGYIKTPKIVPLNANVEDLGSNNVKWRNLYLSGSLYNSTGDQISLPTEAGTLALTNDITHLYQYTITLNNLNNECQLVYISRENYEDDGTIDIIEYFADDYSNILANAMIGQNFDDHTEIVLGVELSSNPIKVVVAHINISTGTITRDTYDAQDIETMGDHSIEEWI